VAGVGMSGRSHLLDLVSSDQFDVTAVCGSRIERSARVACDFGVPKAYDDITEMLATENIEGLVLATPPEITATALAMALKRGIHTLAEKPAALSSDLLESALAQVDSTLGVVAYNRRYQDHVHRARQLLRSARIGDVTSVSCTWTAPFSQRYHPMVDTYRRSVDSSQGMVLDTACHIIDTLAFLQLPPPRIRKARLDSQSFGADIELTLGHESADISATISIQDVGDDDQWSMSIDGTEAKILLNRMRLTVDSESGRAEYPAADIQRPVDDLLALASGRQALGASLPAAIGVLRVIDQLCAIRRRWQRPRAKALGRLNGAC